jgi:hypothetical protein
MRRLILLVVFIAVVMPASVSAQGPNDEDEDSAVILLNSDAFIAADETVENLVVISADAVIEGTVTGSLVVIEGDATISGRVGDSVTVISGDINLLDTAVVDNVHSVRGDLIRAPGATVTGDIDESDFTGFWAAIGVLSVILWVGVTIAAVVAGIVFALIGGRQLRAAATLMTGEAVNAIVGTVFLWVGLPILAVLALITVVGIPLGVGILIFLIPVLGVLGYLVAATRIGSFATGALKADAASRPVVAVLIGVIVLQLVLLIPVIGAVLVIVASIWGAGSLAFIAYRGEGGHDPTPSPAAPPPAAT